MTTSNSTADQVFDPQLAAELREKRKQTISNSLAKRHRKEKTFRFFGFSAVIAGLFFVALLFGSILSKGLPAFWQSSMSLPVYFDPAIITTGAKPVQRSGESPAQFEERFIAWQTEMGMVDWDALIVNAMIAKDPALASKRDDLASLYTSSEAYRLRDMVMKDPSLVGKKEDIKVLADANVDVWLAGNIDRSLPDEQQQLSPEVRQLADEMKASGVMENTFNTNIFVSPDSRSSPATSGLAGAFMGSLFMMLIVIIISIPIGVASAIYLEEFAPKNWITDVIEVNINNLAAVPSIVFGLLGAAIFIGWMHLPLSAPLVGGLVLSLMTLPTVIITTRASLKAVPPSIRQAALGLGASRVQTVFHHVLPLALPGILTGAIIGVAQALGETAPLLLIGMSAFVASVPTTPFDQSSALPVQIFLWQGNELRNFFEGRTAAAIIVLLAMMIGLNSIAIWLRKKFEVRW
ncbi:MULTISPECIES: phosphate ABC transporter permease PstA [Acinetobacter]|jgi:phosphate transport system permease protein|uniref:Phosphate transport system permease protein PstA n=1 Tax=Acinetobacter johnsonii SH046 TaxID=575586 RepID=D0SA08_ACIJO|nr:MULTISPECIES: phosphate ABC transporter permease PstA [Acinetobacter]MDN5444696.1 phosphate ABC transporter permease PstA [Pseudomonadales bacterium]MDN5542425.1 phosphate ABC transporter permease PstA [Acinetobacter sp.]EEY97245.1 phosphate ABC transporter, permease protein PstA [Acinetobacter johnsonii SH046]MDN5556261.1 phosphate ABC transporter permease PstA [Acinetobacter sp.]MDN5644305.1 phosphate ABC transporter permease PstA [Acinetobacter sp.]